MRSTFTARRDAGTRAAIALLIACLLAALSATIGAAATSSAPIAAASNCWDTTATNRFAGNAVGRNSTLNVRGIRAYIDPGLFNTCNSFGAFGNDGISAWVGIVPGESNPDVGNRDAIIQIGIIRCNNIVWSVCGNDGSSTDYHYVWAIGGCNGSIPYPRDLGVADSGRHEYIVRKDDGGSWVLYIDNVVKVTFDGSSKGEVNCWQADDKEGQVLVETLDRGDLTSCQGNACGPHTDIDGVRYQSAANTPWAGIQFYDPCDFNGYTSSSAGTEVRCNVDDSDRDHYGVWNEYYP